MEYQCVVVESLVQFTFFLLIYLNVLKMTFNIMLNTSGEKHCSCLNELYWFLSISFNSLKIALQFKFTCMQAFQTSVLYGITMMLKGINAWAILPKVSIIRTKQMQLYYDLKTQKKKILKKWNSNSEKAR